MRRDGLGAADEAFPQRTCLPDLLANEAGQKSCRDEGLEGLVGRYGLDDLW